MSFWVVARVIVSLLGSARTEVELLASEIETLLCSLTKAQASGAGLKETLLLVDLNEPIDASSFTAIKLEPVVPQERLSQSIS